MKKSLILPLMLTALTLSSCGPTETEIATMTATMWTATPTNTATPTPTNTPTSTLTLTPTLTQTPTLGATVTPAETSTPEAPTALGLMNTYCRWGPGKVYRSSGILLYKDELGLIEGKRVTADGTWYLVRITDAKWNCWVHGSTFELQGDKSAVGLSHVIVPESSKVPAVSGVKANRSKNSVTISWSAAPSAPELEYLIEVIICTKDDYLLEVAYSTASTSF